MEKAGQRLKEIRLKLGLTQQELGDTLGFPWHKIKDIETGRLKLSAEIASNIGEKYSIDGWWLLTGKGSMKPEPLPQAAADAITVPLISHNAQAGKGNDIGGIRYEVVETMTISANLFKSPPSSTVRIIKVEGYSMVPMLYPDTFVIFEECMQFSTDGLYIINYADQLMVKLLQIDPAGRLHIKSVNEQYESWMIDREDQSYFRVVGRVLRVVF